MPHDKILSVLVVGSGSAGCLAAITLKRWLPRLPVTLLRSADIPVIGVGEGTTVGFTAHLHGHLGLDPGAFLRELQPVWKLGGRFIWGKRTYFDYSFSRDLNFQLPQLPKACGFYADIDMTDYGPHAAMMSQNRAFLSDAAGKPVVDGAFAYHLENEPFVCWLEKTAVKMGIEITTGTAVGATQNERGICAVNLQDGRSLNADFFVDASGFRSELLGKTLNEPFVSFNSSLWCDRAIVGGWDRQAEPIQPYTTIETMNAGWSWRIDHMKRINRGYVYCPAFISDAQAEQEFRQHNPKIGSTRIVKFISGRYERGWVKNVAAIGNAFAFVEPLEATSLGMICHASQTLATLLHDSDCHLRETHRSLYNTILTRSFDNIRWFLSIHYKFNNRLETPFWHECRNKVDIGQAEPVVEFFRENGPTPLLRTPLLDQSDPFGTEGYLAILLGQQVAYRNKHTPTEAEIKLWTHYRTTVQRNAQQGLPVSQAMEQLKSPQWKWNRATFLQAPVITRTTV